MSKAICARRLPSGAMCTSPRGHTGDCIAESVWQGNIIDVARREDTTDADDEGAEYDEE